MYKSKREKMIQCLTLKGQFNKYKISVTRFGYFWQIYLQK